ncbi:MAG: ankyrin repeat domain-containing protein [Gammaproteobacteria bacterium]|nr:ankyrin repeat domain-containing protein [Gammaproteobacteria bacterium]
MKGLKVDKRESGETMSAKARGTLLGFSLLLFSLGPVAGPVAAGPLHEAIKSGDSEQAHALITPGLDINARDSSGMAAIHFAVYGDHIELVEMLLGQGADVNIAVDSSRDFGFFAPFRKFSPLHIAIHLNRLEIASLLIAHGVEVNQKTDDGQSALHLAVRKGTDRLVQLLIDNGADVNAKDFEEYTPLHNAAWNGHIGVVEMLVSNGADVNASAYDGYTPYRCAIRKNRTEVVAFLEKLGVVQ